MEGAAWQEHRTKRMCRSGAATRVWGEQWSGPGQVSALYAPSAPLDWLWPGDFVYLPNFCKEARRRKPQKRKPYGAVRKWLRGPGGVCCAQTLPATCLLGKSPGPVSINSGLWI